MDEGLELFRSHWPDRMKEERVPLTQAKGRILAEPQFAQSNIPLVRAAMMDGICVKSALCPDGKPLSPDTWRCGEEYDFADTGDDFPDAYDAVVPIEQVTLDASDRGVAFSDDLVIHPGMYVSPSGRVVREGQLLLPAPRKLSATDLAVLAIGNLEQVPVFRKPRVAFIPTGSELVPVGQPLERGQNVDCNSLMARALLEDQGAEVVLSPIIRDDRDQMRCALEAALTDNDLILINGGSSKGFEDQALRLLDEQGDILFHWSQCGPGRPTALASVAGKPVIVVPGPPYGCLNVLSWLVMPCLAYWLHLPEVPVHKIKVPVRGDVEGPRGIAFLLAAELERSEDGQLSASLINFKKAGVPRCLAADGIIRLTPGTPAWKDGDLIEVTLLREL